MIAYFTSALSYYASLICNFLMTEPIVYFTCGFLAIVAISAFNKLVHLN